MDTYEKVQNMVAESIVNATGGCYLNKDNILWKTIDGEFIGKRSVYTTCLRAVWLEQVEKECLTIRSWWCGEDADYEEIFTRQ